MIQSKKHSRLLTAFIVALVVLMTAQVMYAKGNGKITFGTATPTGIYYMLGAGVGEVVSKYSGIEVEVQSTQGSIANFNMLTEGLLDMAWVGGDAFVQLAIEQKRDISMLRFMGFGPSSGVQLIARKDSGIKNVRDLKGKTVSVGAPGSAGATIQAALLEVGFGLTENNYKPVFLSFNEVIDGLRDKVIDAGIITMSIPTSLILDLSTTVPIQMLEWDSEGIEKIIERYPSYRPSVVPKDTYKGVDEDVTIVAMPSGVTLCQADLSEDTVYEFVKTAFEHNDEIAAIHGAGKELTFENTVSILESVQGKTVRDAIEFHPGYLKYLSENGIVIQQ